MANYKYSHPSSQIKCISVCNYTNARAEIWHGWMVKMVGEDNRLVAKPTLFHNKLQAIQYKDELLKEI
jgi:hypothetical protein